MKLKSIGAQLLKAYKIAMDRTLNAPPHVFYSYVFVAMLFLLTGPVWGRAIDYHWSISLIAASLYLALSASTVWFILYRVNADTKRWKTVAVFHWILSLSSIGLSIIIANGERLQRVIDPFDDGLDDFFAIVVGVVVVAISFWLFHEAGLRLFPEKVKPNGNSAT